MRDQRASAHLQRLREGAWFGKLDEDLQQQIVSRLVPRSVARGGVIHREHAPALGLFTLLLGRIGIFKTAQSGREDLIHVGEAGFWFGELGLLTGRTVVSIRALTAARVLLLPIAAFEEIVAGEPRHYRPFAELALRRFALAFQYVAENHLLPAESLLRVRLAELADMRRLDVPFDGPVVLRLSQDELAKVAGLSRQTANRLLRELQAEGLIELGPRAIRVLDPARLRAV